MRKVVCLVVFNLLLNLYAHADHLFGGDIYFTCLGNNQYQVSVNYYRDCIAILPPASLALNVTNTCGAIPSTYTLVPTSAGQIPLSTNCPNNTCTGGGLSPGVDKTEFTVVVTLTDTCSHWILSADLGQRTTYVTIFDHTLPHDLYLETTINNTVNCDDSPVFTDPRWIVCSSDSNCITHGVNGPGDSTVWSLIPPREGDNQNVPYLPGYSVSNPIDSANTLMINPATGEFCFNSPASVWTNYTVQASNYRNGIVTGQSMRDMSMLLTDCSALPEISGINGGPSTDTVACQFSNICFDIFTDAVYGWDSTTIFWDFGINGSFSKYPGQFEHATFCWTPQVPIGLYCFEVYCYENSCPNVRSSSKIFCISVLDSLGCANWLGEKNIINEQIRIFPQPANDYFRIEFENYRTNYSIIINDLSGRSVYELKNINSNQSEINCEFLSPGIYYLQIIDSNNIRQRNIKFIRAN